MLYSTKASPYSHSRTFEEAANYLSRLHNVATALSEAVTSAQVADVVVTQAAPLLGAQAGVVFALSEDRREFVALRIAGFGPEAPREWARFAADAPLPLADAVRSQSLIVLETQAEREARYPHLAQSGRDIPGALAAVPALRAGHAVGAIGFVFHGSRTFSESERTFLLLLGEQCGAALARADAYDRQQHVHALSQQGASENQSLLLALHASEERLRLLLAATNDGVWDWQPPSGEVFLSARWQDILGRSEDNLPSTFETWASRVHPDDWPRVQAEFEAYLRGETPVYANQHRLRHQDGTYHWVLARGLALRDADGQVIRFLGTNTDITERKTAEEALARTVRDLQAANARLETLNTRLEALATTDSLTGLQNERRFQQSLDDEFRRARRYQSPLSLIMLDVDCFKAYNDAFGHPAGSRALHRLAQLLRQAARATDIVCRYGGEEFALLLPYTGGTEALALAERLRERVERAPWKRRAITISLGVCTLSPDMGQPAALLERADAAMYEAKAAGRNRVVSVSADPVFLTLPLDFDA